MEIKVCAPRKGRCRKLFVKERQIVDAGGKIALIDDADSWLNDLLGRVPRLYAYYVWFFYGNTTSAYLIAHLLCIFLGIYSLVHISSLTDFSFILIWSTSNCQGRLWNLIRLFFKHLTRLLGIMICMILTAQARARTMQPESHCKRRIPHMGLEMWLLWKEDQRYFLLWVWDCLIFLLCATHTHILPLTL